MYIHISFVLLPHLIIHSLRVYGMRYEKPFRVSFSFLPKGGGGGGPFTLHDLVLVFLCKFLFFEAIILCFPISGPVSKPNSNTQLQDTIKVDSHWTHNVT